MQGAIYEGSIELLTSLLFTPHPYLDAMCTEAVQSFATHEGKRVDHTSYNLAAGLRREEGGERRGGAEMWGNRSIDYLKNSQEGIAIGQVSHADDHELVTC